MMIYYAKYFATVILILISSIFIFGQNVTITTQAEMNAYNSSTTVHNGFIFIHQNSFGNDPVTNLNSLSNLITITGGLSISDNTALTNLNGLSNLTSIGQYLKIEDNPALTNLNGLTNLTSIGDELFIKNNPLNNLNGLDNLSSLGGDLDIRSNDFLTNIDALLSITTVNGYLNIYDNNSLTNINGFSNINFADIGIGVSNNENLINIDGLSNITYFGESVRVTGNDALLNIDGLSNLTTLSGNLDLDYNASLLNIDGLANLISVGGRFDIYGNVSLQNINSLTNLTSVGERLLIRENDVITNLDALSNLTYVGGDLLISYNASLNSIDGLSNVTSVVENLTVQANSVLTNIDALSGIFAITGDLIIQYNNVLNNIDGLSNLTSIGGYLMVRYNDALADIDGFYNLASINENFTIRNNPNLINCCSIQDLLNEPGAISGTIEIINNPSECSSESEVSNAICGISISLTNNPPCINASNGSIQVEISNFNGGPFSYNWENTTNGEVGSGISQNESFTIEDLAMGTYNITVTESNEPPVVQTGIELSEILGSVFEIIEITSTNSSNSLSNGSLTLTISGGTAPYSYEWSGQSAGTENEINDDSYVIPNLSQGIYNITVSDDTGNQQITSVNLLDETIPVFPCDQALDIVILNDVSGSVDAIEYSESQQFFVDFLNETNIGSGDNDSRATIIEWSSSGAQNIKIPMTGDISELQNYVNQSRSFYGGTNPQAAMNYGKNYLDNVARTNAEKVLILSTDGSSGQVSQSLIALADQFKAEGYHIITIAFDNAFSNSNTRETLRQVASIDLLAPGAPAYSQLNQNLAENIVNLYLCPIDPGSSATVYFNRDGEIQIIDIEPASFCSISESAEITFTVEAKRELSLPAGTPVTFYYNNPELFGSTTILTWIIPCAIPVGTIEMFTVILPVSTGANIYAILNDDGSQSPAIVFPISNIEEIAYSNNIDNVSVCTDPIPTLQALKNTTTSTPICSNTVMYTVDVCNISSLDATEVIITDVAPTGFMLEGMSINDNGCTNNNGTSFDIPSNCCVSITYIYNASNAANDFYNDQDVHLTGPEGQVYIDFDGMSTTSEDVLIDGTSDCPSTLISFSKEVNTLNTCEDAFVEFTFTINNELNIPLQGLSFIDILASPVNWTFEPYNLQGLTISNSNILGNTASFIIDEVAPNTVATFSLDANLGDWVNDGTLNNTATLENVPDLENGGFQILTSNTTTTTVLSKPEITLPDTLYIELPETAISIETSLTGSTDIEWTTTGDGDFTNTNTSNTIYSFGTEDLENAEVSLFVSSVSDCGEDGKNVVVIIIPTTGLEDVSQDILDVKLYPNPTNNIFQIDIENNIEYLDIVIYNSLSQEILSTSMKESISIDTRSWSNGVYFITIFSKNKKKLGISKILKI